MKHSRLRQQKHYYQKLVRLILEFERAFWESNEIEEQAEGQLFLLDAIVKFLTLSLKQLSHVRHHKWKETRNIQLDEVMMFRNRQTPSILLYFTPHNYISFFISFLSPQSFQTCHLKLCKSLYRKKISLAHVLVKLLICIAHCFQHSLLVKYML